MTYGLALGLLASFVVVAVGALGLRLGGGGAAVPNPVPPGLALTFFRFCVFFLACSANVGLVFSVGGRGDRGRKQLFIGDTDSVPK